MVNLGKIVKNVTIFLNYKHKSTFEKVLKRSGNNWNQFWKELKNENGWKKSNLRKSLEKHFSERNGQLTLYAEQ